MKGLFANRKAIIASMHGKETVIGPILKSTFNIDLHTATDINTDTFGTFSGEVERVKNQYETAKLKIEAAAALYPDYTLIIASEGAFNPHPEAPFINVNTELVLLVDKANGLEIAGWHKSYNTNIAQSEIKSNNDLNTFATEIGFPAHGIILKTINQSNNQPLYFKGGKTIESLEEAYTKFKAIAGKNAIIAETDMRANFNPTRMQNIEVCAKALVENMGNVCPKCNTPGVSIQSSKPGLPCQYCGMPTKSVLNYVYCCQKCQYTYESKRADGKLFEDPMYCDYCNP